MGEQYDLVISGTTVTSSSQSTVCHVSKRLCGEVIKCFLSQIRRSLKFCVSYLQLTYKATANPHDSVLWPR